MNDHPVYWTATLRCTHETSTQGRPAPGNWVSCEVCHSQQPILSVSPILREVTAAGGWVQPPLPFVADRGAA